MLYIFWILGMLGFKWAIVDQCQCILWCVTILLAKLPQLSTTSETLSYHILGYPHSSIVFTIFQFPSKAFFVNAGHGMCFVDLRYTCLWVSFSCIVKYFNFSPILDFLLTPPDNLACQDLLLHFHPSCWTDFQKKKKSQNENFQFSAHFSAAPPSFLAVSNALLLCRWNSGQTDLQHIFKFWKLYFQILKN